MERRRHDRRDGSDTKKVKTESRHEATQDSRKRHSESSEKRKDKKKRESDNRETGESSGFVERRESKESAESHGVERQGAESPGVERQSRLGEDVKETQSEDEHKTNAVKINSNATKKEALTEEEQEERAKKALAQKCVKKTVGDKLMSAKERYLARKRTGIKAVTSSKDD